MTLQDDVNELLQINKNRLRNITNNVALLSDPIRGGLQNTKRILEINENQQRLIDETKIEINNLQEQIASGLGY